MSELEVIRVEPLELPREVVWHFSAMSHVSSMKDFIVYVCDKENKMYVNKSVPEKDIAGFVEVVTFPDYWVDDENGGLGKFLDYVYNTYGYPAYVALLDSHKWRTDREEERKAKEEAKEITPLIDKIALSDYPSIPYSELLIYEVSKRGDKAELRTGRGKISFGDVYIFYLGYLMGAREIKSGYSPENGGNVVDFYYGIIEMLQHIDIQEMPRIYGYLKEMYFPE